MIACTMRAIGQAVAASAVFVVAGVAGFLLSSQSATACLLAGYYAFLVFHSFFSIKTLAVISPEPPHPLQVAFNVVLFGVYVALGLAISSVVLFCVLSASLYLIANVMYAHLYRLVPERRRFIGHKMRINVLGVALSLGALLIALSGYDAVAAGTMCVLYALANVYLLGIHPMYRLD